MLVADLANEFPTETMEAGTVLFEQGGTGGDGLIVQVGKVELSREVGGLVQRVIFVGAGEILGVYKTLFENDARYITGPVVEKSRITRNRAGAEVPHRGQRPVHHLLRSQLAELRRQIDWLGHTGFPDPVFHIVFCKDAAALPLPAPVARRHTPH